MPGRSSARWISLASAPDGHDQPFPPDEHHQRFPSCPHPVDEALTLLEVGLLEDLALMIGVERAGGEVDWDLTAVIGELPARFRNSYTARFVRELTAAGLSLSRQRGVDGMWPDCLAQFILARWVLDRAQLVAELEPGPSAYSREDLAVAVGLIGAGPASPPSVSTSDPWGLGWTIQSIRADPSTWFERAIVRSPRP